MGMNAASSGKPRTEWMLAPLTGNAGGDNNRAFLRPDLFQSLSVAHEPSGVNLDRTCFTSEITG